MSAPSPEAPTEKPPQAVGASGQPEEVPAWGVVRERSKPLLALNAWRKRTPFNPYWTELRWLRRSAAALASRASGDLLDVGCGERPYGELFAPHVRRYVGLEYPATSADVLNPNIWKVLGRIRGIVDLWGDGGRLPFRDACFDTLLGIELLEHVPRPEALLTEFRRVLRPGGKLLLTVPFAAPLHQLPYDYRRFTPGGLRELLARHDFEIEALEPRGNFAAVSGSLLAQYLLRALAAKKRLHDGSVELSRWRAPFVLPLLGALQLLFDLAARASNDTTYCLGYTVVARRP